MQVAVEPVGEIESRAASALAAHPLVERLGLIGRRPPDSWGQRVSEVEDATGFEVVVGSAGRARAAGAVLIAAGPAVDGGPAVVHASPTGLARSLSARLPAPTLLARTVRGEAAGQGVAVSFPRPVGPLRASGVEEGVTLAASPGSVTAVVARDRGRSLAVVDDATFLAAACLAAGAMLAHHALSGPLPVWERAEDYLRACESLGVVIAERVSAERS